MRNTCVHVRYVVCINILNVPYRVIEFIVKHQPSYRGAINFIVTFRLYTCLDESYTTTNTTTNAYEHIKAIYVKHKIARTNNNDSLIYSKH